MSEAIGIVILCVGLAFNLVGCIGLVRLPDIYNRLQAATKCVTLGTCLFIVGIVVMVDCTSCVLKCVICIGFILITSPTAAHALSRGAHASGVKLWKESVLDRYADDGQPGLKGGNS